MYTVDTEEVEKFIYNAVKERKNRIESKENLCIEMRPEFVAALDQCMSFSSNYTSLA